MSFEIFDAGKSDDPCRLMQLAHDVPDKCMDVNELDRPVALTQETRNELPPVSNETRESLAGKGFPLEVIDAIGSEAEAKIYEDAGLEHKEVNGKDALVRNDINYDQKDVFGDSNLERMKQGKPPLDQNGKPVELHHVGQKPDSTLAELTGSEHRSNGNDNVLHDKLKESEINRDDFGRERKEYWQARADQIEKQNA